MGPLHSMKSINFSVAEKILTDWEGSCPSSLEQSSHVISSFLSWQILKAAKWGKESDQLVSYLTTQPTPLSEFQLSKPQCLSTSTHSISFNWMGVFPVSFNRFHLPPPISFSWGGQVPVHCQMKLRTINQYKRAKNQDRLTQIVWSFQGGG